MTQTKLKERIKLKSNFQFFPIKLIKNYPFQLYKCPIILFYFFSL